MKKAIALLLIFALTVSLISGCCCIPAGSGNTVTPSLSVPTAGPAVPNETDPSATDPVTAAGGWEEHLVYTLDQQMVDSFYALLEEAEEMALLGEDLDAIDAITDELDEKYMQLIDQSQIAYVLYCIDQSDEQMSRNYKEADEIRTDAETEYNAMARRVYLSDSPAKDMLFEGWTEEEINLMLAHNEQIAQLEKENTEITMEYRELDPATHDDEMIPLYNRMVAANNRIAREYGYENHYEFAYKMVYQRDYEHSQIQKMRRYVGQYLPELYLSLLEDFENSYNQLTPEQAEEMINFLYAPYDMLEQDYVQNYLSGLPESCRENMRHMFDNHRVVFAQSENSYDGAFTTSINGQPFCYFGPNYVNLETVVHELGHYYGARYVELWYQSIDVSETQSQGSEWLFMYDMGQYLDPQVHECIVTYKMLNSVAGIISYVMIDQFEQRVYSHEDAGDLTRAEYEALMAEVAEGYGGIEFIQEQIMDIQAYWKLVVLESPVYYISYAVSMVAAINLYTEAVEDRQDAAQIYLRLMEQVDEEKGLVGNMAIIGLPGPFDEEVYEDLYENFAD